MIVDDVLQVSEQPALRINHLAHVPSRWFSSFRAPCFAMAPAQFHQKNRILASVTVSHHFSCGTRARHG